MSRSDNVVGKKCLEHYFRFTQTLSGDCDELFICRIFGVNCGDGTACENRCLKNQIKDGNIPWTLKQLKASRIHMESEESSDVETTFLRDLEVLRQCIHGLLLATADPRLKDTAFFEKARCVINGIFEQIAPLEIFFGRDA